MKSKILVATFFGLVLLAFRPAVAAADLSALVATAAKWESGQSLEPLSQIEQCVRESVGDPTRCAGLESALLPMLASEATPEARRFACQQLAVIGSDASVPALAKLLESNETIGIACLAFGNRSSAKADEALRAALATAQGQGRLQIISTLGNRRDPLAVELLSKLARDSDTAVAQTAIRALGKIGNAAASQAVTSLRDGANPVLAAALADATLRCADELAKSGKHKDAAALYETLIAPTQPAYVRRGAFANFLRCDRSDAEKRILQTLQSGDEVLKPVALAAIRDLPSRFTSSKFGSELPKLPSQEQVWLIESLAARGDSSARSAIAKTLGASADSAVRRAAALALGRIGNASSVKPLARALATAKDETEANACLAALAALPDERSVERAILSEMKAAKGALRAQLISTLTARRGPKVVAALLKETGNPDPLPAKAAYRVLAKATTAQTLPALLGQFAAIRDAGLREAVESFIAQAVLTVENPADRSAAVRSRLARADHVGVKVALIRLLPACGDEAALRALKDARADADASVRNAAVAALAEWPDNAAWETLGFVCRNPENDPQHAAALRGMARLFGERAAISTDPRTVTQAQELLDAARSVADLKLVLGALSSAKEAGVLKLVLPLLHLPVVRAEAEVAVRKIADAVKATDPQAASQAFERLKKP